MHFLSLGGGEIALGWWFEECLVPYLINTSKLEAVQSISIVTGYGKTRSRGARMNDDGMRLRVRAMLKYMDIHETPQPNKGRIHIDKGALIKVVKKNGGRIRFDLEGYTRFKEEETTANKFPDVVQQVRARFRPARPGQGPPGTFIRDGDPVPAFKSSDEERRNSMMERRPTDIDYPDYNENRRPSSSRNPRDDRAPERGFDQGRPSGDDRMHGRGANNFGRTNESWNQDQRRGDEWRGGQRDGPRRGSYNDHEGNGRGGYRGDRPDNGMDRRGGGNRDFNDNRPGIGNESDRRGGERHQEPYDRRGGNRNWEGGNDNNMKSEREYDPNMRGPGGPDRRRGDDRGPRPPMNRTEQPPSSYYPDDRRNSFDNRSGGPRSSRRPDTGGHSGPNDVSAGFRANRNDHEFQGSDYQKQQQQPPPSRGYDIEPSYNNNKGEPEGATNGAAKKRSYDDYQKQQPPSRGYDIKPAYVKRRSSS